MNRRLDYYPCILAAVAAGATRRDAGMAHDRPEEAGGILMACIASGTRCDRRDNMGRRFGCAAICTAVVATGCASAIPNHCVGQTTGGMIERSYQEAGVIAVCVA